MNRAHMLELGLDTGLLEGVGVPRRLIIHLGYVRPPLSLNDRKHWRSRHRVVREVRTRVSWRVRQAAGRAGLTTPHVHVQLAYVPPDARVRDPDNLVATLKPCIDALTQTGKDRGWPAYPLVADDDPAHVSWSPPRIDRPDGHGPRMWLILTLLTSAAELPEVAW